MRLRAVGLAARGFSNRLLGSLLAMEAGADVGNAGRVVAMKAARQVGALCVCKANDDQLHVLLVTSRDTRRWIIPKGWPMKGLEPYEAAAREALEEGGVYGKTGARAVGRYRYYRKSKKGARVHVVSVYLIAVRGALDHWEEEAERKRAWFSVSSAVRRVAEPELRSIIRRVESVRDHPEWQSVGQLRARPANADPRG